MASKNGIRDAAGRPGIKIARRLAEPDLLVQVAEQIEDKDNGKDETEPASTADGTTVGVTAATEQ
jgi:hypothetical protein